MRSRSDILKVGVRRAAISVVLAVAALAGATALRADDKPLLSPDPVGPAEVPSSIAAIVEFSLPALQRDLERSIPKRLATFSDRTRSCWHRQFLGRTISIDCEYSGFVERTGAVSLRAEGRRLVAALPLYGTVSARGARGLLGLIQGKGEGQMNVVVASQPRLRPDWSVALDLSEGFRWTEPPTVDVLGFSINLTRFIEPQIRKQLARVQAQVATRVRALDLRGRAEAAWRHAFANVRLSDEPEIWLQAKPQSVAFSGLEARGDGLEGAVDFKGTAETTVGPEPSNRIATPLPQLGHGVAEPGRFEIIMPVRVAYPAVAQKFRDALSARFQAGGVTIHDVSVYPSQGKIVAAIRWVETKPGSEPGPERLMYLSTTPRFDDDGQAITLADLSKAAGITDALPAPMAALLSDPSALEALRQELRLRYQDERDRLIASANAKLSRSIGDGFRSEGRLTSATPETLVLGPDGLTAELRASGTLKLLYGL